jgi:hypothetical protein
MLYWTSRDIVHELPDDFGVFDFGDKEPFWAVRGVKVIFVLRLTVVVLVLL